MPVFELVATGCVKDVKTGKQAKEETVVLPKRQVIAKDAAAAEKKMLADEAAHLASHGLAAKDVTVEVRPFTG